MDFASEIKSRVPATELIPFYGIEINRSGFCCCPFHGEKTPSMKVYPGDRGFCCFGCHATGSVIDFVMQYFGLRFNDAVMKINDDFRLGLPIGQKLSREQQIENARLAYIERRKREQRQREKRRLDAAAGSAFDEWHRLDDQKRLYAPKKIGEEFHPLFAEALRDIAGANYRMDLAEAERYEYEQRNH